MYNISKEIFLNTDKCCLYCLSCDFIGIPYMNVIVPSLNITGQGVDVPLSETGFKQAAAAGIFLNNVKFTHVFSSDLMRTKQVSSESQFRLKSQVVSSCNLERSATRVCREFSLTQMSPLPSPGQTLLLFSV